MTPFTKEQQLRGKPEKKKSGKIPYQSKAMQAKNAEYHRVLDEIDQERDPVCQGCGKPEFSHSHSIPRAYKAYAFISEKSNIWRLCLDCHARLYESGRVWQLRCGEQVMENIKLLDEQYYRQKLTQVSKRLNEFKEKNWLQISQGLVVIPKWVENILEE